MIWASTFWAMTRICSRVRLRPVKRASAAVLAIMSADDPEMPAPAGDSESVSISRPSLGAKNCSSRAARGRRKRLVAAQGLEAGKLLLAAGIDRAQMNALSLQRRDPAGGEDVDREIHRERAGMEQIQRPQIDGASSQVSPAGGLGDDGRSAGGVGGFSHAVFYHEAAQTGMCVDPVRSFDGSAVMKFSACRRFTMRNYSGSHTLESVDKPMVCRTLGLIVAEARRWLWHWSQQVVKMAPVPPLTPTPPESTGARVPVRTRSEYSDETIRQSNANLIFVKLRKMIASDTQPTDTILGDDCRGRAFAHRAPPERPSPCRGTEQWSAWAEAEKLRRSSATGLTWIRESRANACVPA